MVALLDGAEREHATRVPPVASLVDRATAPGSASSWSSSPSPSGGSGRARQPRPRRWIGRCLPRRPAPLLEPAHDHDRTALRQGLGRMLGLVPPHDHGEERRLLLPPPRHGHPEHGPGDPCLGVADLRVVGQVAGEAHGCLGHGPAPSCCLGGRSALPLDRGDGGHRGMPRESQGQAVEPTKSAIDQPRRPWVGSGAGLVGGACAWGSGMPAPSGQIPSTLAWWENEAPATRAPRRPVPGRSSETLPTRGCFTYR
jgi:hypothetical protein